MSTQLIAYKVEVADNDTLTKVFDIGSYWTKAQAWQEVHTYANAMIDAGHERVTVIPVRAGGTSYD